MCIRDSLGEHREGDSSAALRGGAGHEATEQHGERCTPVVDDPADVAGRQNKDDPRDREQSREGPKRALGEASNARRRRRLPPPRPWRSNPKRRLANSVNWETTARTLMPIRVGLEFTGSVAQREVSLK